LEKKTKKREGKLEKKMKKCKKKEAEKTLWINVIIHSDLGVGK
jgi:hypothetical protein